MPTLGSKLAHYTGIMLDALTCLLCSKLCWHTVKAQAYHLPYTYLEFFLFVYFALESLINIKICK